MSPVSKPASGRHRNRVRCSHPGTDSRDRTGWTHPAHGVEAWPHECCGLVGHCPVGDPPNFDELPHGAAGDWLIGTQHSTRFFLLDLGSDRPRWWRVPGSPHSSRAYSRGTYRLGALHGRPDAEPTWGGDPVRVGHPFTIGVGFLSDLWLASRVVHIRRLTAAEARTALAEQSADER